MWSFGQVDIIPSRTDSFVRHSSASIENQVEMLTPLNWLARPYR
jgi:hypothetical protein